MFSISNWLTKGGIDEIIAPYPSYPNRSAEPTNERGSTNNVVQENHVQCIHCQLWTPIHPTLPIQPAAASSSEKSGIFTPRRLQKPDFPNLPPDESLGFKALSAAVDLAASISSPTATWEPIKNFFNLCASTSALTAKQLSKLERQLEKDPSLIEARSSNMGNVAPDGFTPIHAAAYAGNLPVVELLITFRPEVVHLVDVQGRKALAVASKQGHVNVVAVLKNAMGIPNEDGSSIVFPIGKDAPVDLSGRTPLAWAMTSSVPLAIRNRTRLEQELFSPEDKSIVGIFTPPSYRMGGDRLASRSTKPQLASSMAPQTTSNSLDDGLAITYGFSEMPGLRIEMEDAMCYHYPMRLKTGSTVGFFGVFDGHGDGGFASRFVADHIAEYFVQAEIWDSIETQSNEKDYPSSVSQISNALEFACIKADTELRNIYSAKGANITAGGSTGVMAVITTDYIVVANVGDSRCILVQKTSAIIGEHDVGVEALEKGLNDLRLQDETKVLQPSFSSEDRIVVTALSEDHKPNLPHELQRIIKAGYEVVPDRLDSALIWKIKKSDTDKIAVSRAFGDFDYKEKTDLAAHEQAIICIPEITVHERKADLDMFLVLACDGVYDVMENFDIGHFILRATEDTKSAAVIPETADLLLKKCLECGSRDNMSVMIVSFTGQATFEETASSSMNPKALSFVDE